MVKFYNDGVVQLVTFAYLIYTDEFLVLRLVCSFVLSCSPGQISV